MKTNYVQTNTCFNLLLSPSSSVAIYLYSVYTPVLIIIMLRQLRCIWFYLLENNIEVELMPQWQSVEHLPSTKAQ